MSAELKIIDLHVEIEGQQIVKGVDLTIEQGKTHVLMGPNGSGKSTLAQALMGHPQYQVARGQVLLDGEDLLGLGPDERARQGLFLAFQYPVSVPGVSLGNFLRMAVSAVRLQGDEAEKYHDPQRPEEMPMVPMREFRKELNGVMQKLGIPREFAKRYLNDGFSGGEKKRAEILQMALLKPRFAIMDETDSGLDIDGVRTVAEGIRTLGSPELGVLVITHYKRILEYLSPDYIHVMLNGRIVESGGAELATELESHGYDWLREKYGEPAAGAAPAEALTP